MKGPSLRTRARRGWRSFSGSLLFLPTLFVVGAVALFAAVGVLDERLSARPGGIGAYLGRGVLSVLVFGGTAGAARSTLSAIASSWATILGVAYTVTLVTIQLSATKYSAQVIPAFERDRLNQTVLGLFAATVVYSLLVLKTVREGIEPGATSFTPALGVNVAVLLAVASLLLLIVFLGNLTAYIRPTRFVSDLARKGIEALDRMRRPRGIPGFKPAEAPGPAPEEGHVLEAGADGYLVAVDYERLRDVVCDAARTGPGPARLVLLAPPTARHTPHDPVARIHGVTFTEETERGVLEALTVSEVRDPTRDGAYVVESLGDVAITALSGGATDTGVAKASLGAVLRLAAEDLARPPIEATFTLHAAGPPVLFERVVDPPHARALVEAKRILDKARAEGYWDVAESACEDLARLVRSAGDDRRDELETWLRGALPVLLGFEDASAVGRIVARIEGAAAELTRHGRERDAAILLGELAEAREAAPEGARRDHAWLRGR